MRSEQETTHSRPGRKRPAPCFRKACRSRPHSYLPHIQPLPKSSQTCIEGPFGEVIRSTGPMARNNPFRFSTKYDDDESDLLYYGYRYYKPSTGTWPNRDPLGEPGFELLRHGKANVIAGSSNLYEFVKNDAIDYNDPFGLSRWSCFKQTLKDLGEPITELQLGELVACLGGCTAVSGGVLVVVGVPACVGTMLGANAIGIWLGCAGK
ncbi:MAG: RHS repeat-associated core domain-containing protein [Verrucomicrobiota bacterium]